MSRELNKKVGNEGENLACQYLEELGYKILARNWFNKEGKMLGEIDIVAKDLKNVIIFVEVKTRRIFSQNLEKEIQPEEQITSQKMNKLQKIAENYISENNFWESDWQFDAISVIFFENLSPKITHLENIFL